MKPEKLWSLFNFYDNELANRDHPAQQLSRHQYEAKHLTNGELLRHCRWMCNYAMTMFRSEYEDQLNKSQQHYRIYASGYSDIKECMEAEFKILAKAMRWLGYIQGVINTCGLFGVNELRDHSRSDGQPFQDPIPGVEA